MISSLFLSLSPSLCAYPQVHVWWPDVNLSVIPQVLPTSVFEKDFSKLTKETRILNHESQGSAGPRDD